MIDILVNFGPAFILFATISILNIGSLAVVNVCANVAFEKVHIPSSGHYGYLYICSDAEHLRSIIRKFNSWVRFVHLILLTVIVVNIIAIAVREGFIASGEDDVLYGLKIAVLNGFRKLGLDPRIAGNLAPVFVMSAIFAMMVVWKTYTICRLCWIVRRDLYIYRQ